MVAVAVKSHFTAIFSSCQQDQWQCVAQFINQHQQQITITCSSQDTAVACMQLRSAVLRDHAAGHWAHPCRECPSWSQSREIHTSRWQPIFSADQTAGHECSHAIHNILLGPTIGPCPVHSLANYTQLSSPYIYTEFLVYKIIFEKYC